MIVLGDAGINYFGGERDRLLKQRLSETPISFICIHGNHEMRPDNIPSYRPDMEFLGHGWYEPRYPNIFFAMDGEAFFINGKRCLVVGGAYSVDKPIRLAFGWHWWPDEQPSQAIKARVESTIARLDNRIDIVLSHTCPAKYIPTETFIPGVDQSTVDTSTEEWLDKIEQSLSYGRWLCGHYHTDKTVDRMRFMFNDIMLLEEA